MASMVAAIGIGAFPRARGTEKCGNVPGAARGSWVQEGGAAPRTPDHLGPGG